MLRLTSQPSSYKLSASFPGPVLILRPLPPPVKSLIPMAAAVAAAVALVSESYMRLFKAADVPPPSFCNLILSIYFLFFTSFFEVTFFSNLDLQPQTTWSVETTWFSNWKLPRGSQIGTPTWFMNSPAYREDRSAGSSSCTKGSPSSTPPDREGWSANRISLITKKRLLHKLDGSF